MTFFNVEAKGIPVKNIGFNCAGMMASIDWSNQEQVLKFVDTLNAIQPDVLRVFDGGGYRYLHVMFDKDGNPSEGLGYRREDFDDALAAGDLSEEEYQSYLRKLDDQAGKPRYIDMFVHLFAAMKKKPRVIYVANIKGETPENEFAAIQHMLDNGVHVFGVEMGNETYGHTFGDFDAYIEACQPLADLIMRMTPVVKISLVAAPIGARRHEKWNNALSAFLQAPLFRVDAIVPHIYNKVYDDSVEKFENAAQEDAAVVPGDTALATVYTDRVNQLLSNRISDDINAYSVLFPNINLWITEWGTSPAYPFGNSFVDPLHILINIHSMWGDRVEVACYQTLLGPDFHGSMTILKDEDPDAFTAPVARAKYFAWLLLSDIPGYLFTGMTEYASGVYELRFAHPDRKVAAIYVNYGREPFKPEAMINGGYSLGFNTILGISFSDIYMGNGANYLHVRNKFYKANKAEAVLSFVGEDDDTVPPMTIAVCTYDMILVEPGDQAGGRPKIKLPANKKGLFGRFVRQFLKWF